MPGIGWRFRHSWQRRSLVASCLVVLLAIGPWADRGPLVAAGGWLAVQTSDIEVDALAETREPVTAPRPHQSIVPGLLSRLLTGDGKGGPPGKAPSVAASLVREPLLALETTASFGGLRINAPHPSSLGTARTPTGPPA